MIVVRAAFYENNKYYPQVLLDECYNILLLRCSRTDVSEGIDVNKTSQSKEWDICHYWYMSNKGLKFQSYFFNGRHDLVMMSMNLSNIAILNIKVVIFAIISGISKCQAINLMQNVDFTDKSGTL